MCLGGRRITDVIAPYFSTFPPQEVTTSHPLPPRTLGTLARWETQALLACVTCPGQSVEEVIRPSEHMSRQSLRICEQYK